MFDIGWSEMAVIAVVVLIFIGPKELPTALKTFAQWMKQARKMAREFQSGIDDIVREAELEDARKTLRDVRNLNIGREIEKAVDPTGDLKKSLNEESSLVPAPALAQAPAASALPAAPAEAAAPPVEAAASEAPAAAAASEPVAPIQKTA